MSMLDAALRLAKEYRLPVFPCKSDKAPLTAQGFKDATTDEIQIRKWWTDYPTALIGVPTGAETGLLVIDIDPAGVDFLLDCDDLATARQQATRRGTHCLFKYPPGKSIRCSTSKLAEGVDVRADGGYIIWWAACGFNVSGPEIDKLPLPPKNLLDRLPGAPPREGPTAGSQAVKTPLDAEPRLGLSLAEIVKLLEPINPDIGYEDWVKALMAVHHETGGSEAGFALVDEWSSKGSKYKGVADVTSHWRSFKADRAQIVGAAWLKKFSAQNFAAHNHAPRFVVVPDSEYADRKPLTWLIKGVLPRAELAVLFGASGSGKSFLVFDMAAAIATGQPWRDRKVTQGRVVVIVAEGALGYRNRLAAYVRQHDGGFPGIGIIADQPNLLADRDHLELAKQIEAKGGADLIVIDTLAAASPGANENAGEDMGKIIAHCKQLHKATGALVLLVHHSGKDESKGARGWSGLRAAVDVEIEIGRREDYRLATITKMKDGDEGTAFAFRLLPVEVGTDEDGEPITSCVVEALTTVPSPARIRAPQPGSIAHLVLNSARDILPPGGNRVAVSAILDAAVERVVRPEKRDTRRQHAKRALQSLSTEGLLMIEGDECVFS